MTGSQTPEPDQVKFRSRARVTSAIVGRPPSGKLTLAGDRLTFVTADGRTRLDVAVGELTDVKSPWYMLGEGLRFTVAGKRYTCSFNLSQRTLSHLLQIPSARDTCRVWMSFLGGSR